MLLSLLPFMLFYLLSLFRSLLPFCSLFPSFLGLSLLLSLFSLFLKLFLLLPSLLFLLLSFNLCLSCTCLGNLAWAEYLGSIGVILVKVVIFKRFTMLSLCLFKYNGLLKALVLMPKQLNLCLKVFNGVLELPSVLVDLPMGLICYLIN
jgi:hypothetical protein